jgi:hypothetical protein
LRKDGLDDFDAQGYSTMRLAAHLRELDRMDKPLPKHLAELIEPNTVTNLIVKGEK